MSLDHKETVEHDGKRVKVSFDDTIDLVLLEVHADGKQVVYQEVIVPSDEDGDA